MVGHDPDGAAHCAGDLLLQAVEGMDRPLFVLDEAWRFRYINPAGARRCSTGPSTTWSAGDVWEEFPEAVGGPFEENYERVAAPGEPGSTEAWFEPLRTWFRVDAFLTEGGARRHLRRHHRAAPHRGGARRGGGGP